MDKMASLKKYVNKLSTLEHLGKIESYEHSNRYWYWHDLIVKGKSDPVIAWTRLAYLRMHRVERGLEVTPIPYLEDYLKEVS